MSELLSDVIKQSCKHLKLRNNSNLFHFFVFSQWCLDVPLQLRVWFPALLHLPDSLLNRRMEQQTFPFPSTSACLACSLSPPAVQRWGGAVRRHMCSDYKYDLEICSESPSDATAHSFLTLPPLSVRANTDLHSLFICVCVCVCVCVSPPPSLTPCQHSADCPP